MHILKRTINNKYLVLSASLFFITLCIFIFLPPAWNEKIFGEHIYPLVRAVLNRIDSWLPFPLFYIALPMMLLDISSISIYYFIKKQNANAFKYIFSYLLSIAILFFWMWGFFYHSPILVKQPSINQIKMRKETVLKTFKRAEKYRNLLQTDSISPYRSKEIVKLMKDSSEVWLQKTMKLMGKKSRPIANDIKFWPRGFLMRNGIVGMYFPFTGESTVDGAIHALRFPSTALHELSHSMGFTNEGDCNLLAYLAAQFSKNPFVRYSAELERVNEGLYFVAMQDTVLYKEIKDSLPQIVAEDLQNIRNFHSKYYGRMSEMGNWANDRYLKTLSGENGINEYWMWVLKLQILEDEGKL
ncbi:MAG: DUF3810 domain-containing protein [Chitinophagales bacterium]|nr:DUF3810 domain-containing protein [Chitinophagales bacterium]